jgi:hypothetical protein
MTPDARIEGEDLIIKLGWLMDRLDVEDRRRLFKFLLWDEETMKWFLDFIIEGYAPPDWDYPGREFYLQLRQRLMAGADGAVCRALAELSAAYAHEQFMVEHYRRWAWKIRDAWPYNELPRDEEGHITQPPKEPDWPRGPYVYGDDELDLAEKIRLLVVRCELCGRERGDTQRRKFPAVPERYRRCCLECWERSAHDRLST